MSEERFRDLLPELAVAAALIFAIVLVVNATMC